MKPLIVDTTRSEPLVLFSHFILWDMGGGFEGGKVHLAPTSYFESIHIDDLALAFSTFCGFKYPLTLEQLLHICHRSKVKIEHSPKNAASGFNFPDLRRPSFEDGYVICLDPVLSEKEATLTLIHEIFEVVLQILAKISNVEWKEIGIPIEPFAERFAEMVYEPRIRKRARETTDNSGAQSFRKTDLAEKIDTFLGFLTGEKDPARG